VPKLLHTTVYIYICISVCAFVKGSPITGVCPQAVFLKISSTGQLTLSISPLITLSLISCSLLRFSSFIFFPFHLLLFKIPSLSSLQASPPFIPPFSVSLSLSHSMPISVFLTLHHHLPLFLLNTLCLI